MTAALLSWSTFVKSSQQSPQSGFQLYLISQLSLFSWVPSNSECERGCLSFVNTALSAYSAQASPLFIPVLVMGQSNFSFVTISKSNYKAATKSHWTMCAINHQRGRRRRAGRRRNLLISLASAWYLCSAELGFSFTAVWMPLWKGKRRIQTAS